MDVIVVQSEGAVKFLSFAPSLLAWNEMEQLVLLDVFICADITNDSSVWIIMSYLLFHAVLIHNHAVVAHVVLNVVMPAIDRAVGVE